MFDNKTRIRLSPFNRRANRQAKNHLPMGEMGNANDDNTTAGATCNS